MRVGNSSQGTKMVPEMTIKINRSIRNTYVCVSVCMRVYIYKYIYLYTHTYIYTYKLLFIVTASPLYFNMISPPSQPYPLEKLNLSFPTQE